MERRDAVATVVLNRPESHNAINVGMYTALPDLVRGLDEDSSVKVIVFRGAGEKSFASGADISEFEKERGNAAAPAATTRRSPGPSTRSRG